MTAHRKCLTVVIPAYLAEQHIGEALLSLAPDSDVIREVIIIEDGQLDQTAECIRQLPDHTLDLQLIQNPHNIGAQATRNMGLSLAQTEYVMFLDADDYVGPQLIRSLLASITTKGADFCIGPCMKLFPSGKTITTYPKADETPASLVRRWLTGNKGFNPSCMLWRTTALRSIGGWDESIVRNQDGELVIRTLTSNLSLATTLQGYGVYRQHHAPSISKTKTEKLYATQEKIESMAHTFLSANDPVCLSILNTFRFQTAIHAYMDGFPAIGNYWIGKWKHAGGRKRDLITFNKSSKVKKLLYMLAGPKLAAHILRGRQEAKNRDAR